MNFEFKISENIHKIISLICLNVIEIVLLAYYASYDLEFSKNLDFEDDFSAFKGLSITGSVIMMITWVIQIVLIYKYNEKILYSILAINSFSLFILLVGMGMGAQGINKMKDLQERFGIIQQDDFNYPVGLWFIQLCLYLMSLVSLHNLKQKKVSTQVQSLQLSTQNNLTQGNILENNETQFAQQQQIA